MIYWGSAGAAMTTLKLTTIGNSVGIVLPGELLARLRVAKGGSLYVTETSRGVGLSPYRPGFARQMDDAEETMRENATC
jgi:putative addiction module antidote